MADMTQGALPVLLPFLIPVHHLSYAAAAGIVFAATIVSSVVQPIFGHVADRLSKPWFIPAGVLLAGLGVGAIGIVPSYHLILLVVAVSGLEWPRTILKAPVLQIMWPQKTRPPQ